MTAATIANDYDQLIIAFYEHGATMMAEGHSEDEIEDALVDQGLDCESAQTIVAELATMRAEVMVSEGRKNMLFGALWCVGGIAVTAATFSAAAGSGSYVVAYGAIFYGAIQFFRGALQSS